jgi:hypothetical protein
MQILQGLSLTSVPRTAALSFRRPAFFEIARDSRDFQGSDIRNALCNLNWLGNIPGRYLLDLLHLSYASLTYCTYKYPHITRG